MNICLTCKTQTSNNKFCSRSCAAKHNNSLFPKRKRAKRNNCRQCGKECSKNAANYCSFQCQRKYERITRVESGEAGIRCIRSYMINELRLSSCSVCELHTWNEKPIPLEIDHIDGNSSNNSLSNLRFLCPNCHAQTPTYKNKNKGKGRAFRRERYTKGKSY